MFTMFSFLRGRLRTKERSLVKAFGFGFHSFEVGFGLRVLILKGAFYVKFSFLRGRLRTKVVI